MNAYLQKILVAISTILFWTAAQAQLDYGYMYAPNLPNERRMEGLPYSIPCAKAKNQYGADFYRCTWMALPRNITQWNAQQQRNVTYSNQLNGTCRRGKFYVANESGLYGIYGQDISFSLSIYYYIYESEDGYPIAYLMNGGPNNNGKSVTYEQARTILQGFLLDRGLTATAVNDNIARYDSDKQELNNSVVDDAPEPSTEPLSKPTKNIVVTKAWCNPRADDDCTINEKKVPKAQLNQYLPEIYGLDLLNAGGYCEHPICYDKDDKSVGIH